MKKRLNTPVDPNWEAVASSVKGLFSYVADAAQIREPTVLTASVAVAGTVVAVRWYACSSGMTHSAVWCIDDGELCVSVRTKPGVHFSKVANKVISMVRSVYNAEMLRVHIGKVASREWYLTFAVTTNHALELVFQGQGLLRDYQLIWHDRDGDYEESTSQKCIVTMKLNNLERCKAVATPIIARMSQRSLVIGIADAVRIWINKFQACWYISREVASSDCVVMRYCAYLNTVNLWIMLVDFDVTGGFNLGAIELNTGGKYIQILQISLCEEFDLKRLGYELFCALDNIGKRGYGSEFDELQFTKQVHPVHYWANMIISICHDMDMSMSQIADVNSSHPKWDTVYKILVERGFVEAGELYSKSKEQIRGWTFLGTVLFEKSLIVSGWSPNKR